MLIALNSQYARSKSLLLLFLKAISVLLKSILTEFTGVESDREPNIKLIYELSLSNTDACNFCKFAA